MSIAPSPIDFLQLFADTDQAVRRALESVKDWGLADTKEGQHHSDLAADKAALTALRSGFPELFILSEESGITNSDGDNLGESFDFRSLEPGTFLIVLDPLDGSSNAAMGIPWYAISLCVLDSEGPLAGYVSNMAAPELPAYTAIRGEGAYYGETSIKPTGVTMPEEALVSVSALPRLGWPKYLERHRQLRAFGAAALEICLVASGCLDAYIDCSEGSHAPWDYLAALLITQEAGGKLEDAAERTLLEMGMNTRRQPLAAATPELFDQIKFAIKGA